MLSTSACGGDSAPDNATDTAASIDADAADDVTVPAVKVDVLLVVDDTVSMCEEQASLAESFGGFLERIESAASIDYRLAVVTTDMLSAGFSGQFRADTVTETSFLCAKKTTAVCLRPETLEMAQASYPEVVAQCLNKPDCLCDPGYQCDAPSNAKNVLNCNGSINTACRKTCTVDADCDRAFRTADEADACESDPSKCRYKCLRPGGEAQSGCVLRPPTDGCPESPALRSALISNAGLVCDDGASCTSASDCDTNDDGVHDDSDGDCSPPAHPWLTSSTAKDYFKCVGVVGGYQSGNKTLEQGLNATIWALRDAVGAPNAAQARTFLRDDAVLVVVMISDEDDCSIADCGEDPVDGQWKCGTSLRKQYYGECSCLEDTDDGGPLVSVRDAIVAVKALKPDPSQVLVAAIVGDSTATDVADRDAARTLFTQSQCNQCPDPEDDNAGQLNPYICESSSGRAHFGRRYAEFVAGFGANGVVTNICSDEGLGPALQTIADKVTQFIPSQRAGTTGR